MTPSTRDLLRASTVRALASAAAPITRKAITFRPFGATTDGTAAPPRAVAGTALDILVPKPTFFDQHTASRIAGRTQNATAFAVRTLLNSFARALAGFAKA